MMSDVTVRILIDGKIVATHTVKRRSPEPEDADLAARGDALRAAIHANQISISQALVATIEIVPASEGTGDRPSGPSAS